MDEFKAIFPATILALLGEVTPFTALLAAFVAAGDLIALTARNDRRLDALFKSANAAVFCFVAFCDILFSVLLGSSTRPRTSGRRCRPLPVMTGGPLSERSIF